MTFYLLFRYNYFFLLIYNIKICQNTDSFLFENFQKIPTRLKYGEKIQEENIHRKVKFSFTFYFYMKE